LNFAALDACDRSCADGLEVFAREPLMQPDSTEGPAERRVLLDILRPHAAPSFGIEFVQNGVSRSFELAKTDGLARVDDFEMGKGETGL
jgi:hypothetical protein